MAKTCSINNPCSKKMGNTLQRTIHGEPLEAVDHHKYLGVEISRDLNRWNYVSVKSKLQHAPPPRAYPGHLTPLPSRGGGNLIIRVFPGVGNLIPML